MTCAKYYFWEGFGLKRRSLDRLLYLLGSKRGICTPFPDSRRTQTVSIAINSMDNFVETLCTARTLSCLQPTVCKDFESVQPDVQMRERERSEIQY